MKQEFHRKIKVGSLILLSIVCLNCKNSKPMESITMETQSESWSITSSASYSNQELVSITLTNNSENTLLLFDPLIKVVEKKIEDGWEKVSILYCGCEPCPPPPNQLEFVPGAKHVFSWNKESSSCDGNGGIPKKELVTSGKYRVKFRVQQEPKSRPQLIHVEFEL